MATLDTLKQALKQKAETTISSSKQSLTDAQYAAGFETLLQGQGWKTYENFIVPQLSQLIGPLCSSHKKISVLEIGPGPNSVLEYLPQHLRRKIGKYRAFEPNLSFATRLENSFHSSKLESPLPCLDHPAIIHPFRFITQDKQKSILERTDSEKYDFILFCHSMYGINPKHQIVRQALAMLEAQRGILAVFHRENLELDDLVSYRTALYPTGVIEVEDSDKQLDPFTQFVAGFTLQDLDMDEAIRVRWREICRTLGGRPVGNPDHLVFASPELMVAFTQQATSLPELMAQMPLLNWHRRVKNPEARLRCPTAILRPTEIQHIQCCVEWALKHNLSLTVIGGSHSGHCLWPSIVAIDMSAFNQIRVIETEKIASRSGSSSDVRFDSVVIVETGCDAGDIVCKTTEKGLIVPLGSRPSVGAGLWLQGGIGHLARLHGLTCDAIVGAVMVSAGSGQVLCIGHVPDQQWPIGGVRPENERDLLWAIKGAGTNFGIVVSVVFKAFTAATYTVRNWIAPLRRLDLADLNRVADELSRDNSVDAYLYRDNEQCHLGITMFDSSSSGPDTDLTEHMIFGSPDSVKQVDSIGLFDADMYLTLHGGHSSGKTSSFKRCLFLKDIGRASVTRILMLALENCPTPLSYFHLLQGGGAIGNVPIEETAFGCRDWDFACVVTGVWLRDQDGTKEARAVVEWVYGVATKLLPVSMGVYGADLGLDPRDAILATRAFGSNRQRLASLKHSMDPTNVLAYACPLPKQPQEQKVIFLVTGEKNNGKDFCAEVWADMFHRYTGWTVKVVSISEATKREYAISSGANLDLLLHDRAYKEQHRPNLTIFYQNQLRARPQLAEEHFKDLVSRAADVDVLFITGMREDTPVAAYSHLVSDSRLVEIRVEASEESLSHREYQDTSSKDSTSKVLDYSPDFIFHNDTIGTEAVKEWAKDNLLPFLDEGLQRLRSMVRQVADFPQPEIEFHHVLGISHQTHGLSLCISLLHTYFSGRWTEVDAIVCCEAGGFVFASALACRVDLPLVPVRDVTKLPPPLVSVIKDSSYISSSNAINSQPSFIAMEEDVIPKGSSIVVVDDVLSSGRTLCAVLQLMGKVGISPEEISVLVVAEFPFHRGRDLLKQRGFGKVRVQSLLVFSGK